jgi:heme-degrading monooxygenase HmoA
VIVMFSARRLKPGSWEDFRKAWDPGEEGERPPGLERVIHARNIRDEDEVISFGIFDMSKDDYHRWRGEHDEGENERVDHMAEFIENTGTEGVFEVIETLDD